MLVIVCYDVNTETRAGRRRLRRVARACEGVGQRVQKSVFECFLTPSEKADLLAEVEEVLDLVEDRFFLLRLDLRSKVRTLGIGVKPQDPAFYYIG